MMGNQGDGRVPQAEPGSREPEPLAGPAASGFDPSRERITVDRAILERARAVVREGALTLEDCGQVIAACTERMGRLLGALLIARSVAEEVRVEWDEAPAGMRAGKLLIALSGALPGYRADIDEIHAAISEAISPDSFDTKALKACTCIETIDAKLAEDGHSLDLAFVFSGNTIVARPYSRLLRKDNGRAETRSGRRCSFIASFCPFCGTKYEEAK
jgi:hypothetical protein